MVLSEDGGHGSVDTVCDHRVCDPYLFCAPFGRSWRVGRCGRVVREDQVVGGDMEGSCDTVVLFVKCHVVDLYAPPSVPILCWRQARVVVLFSKRAFVTLISSMTRYGMSIRARSARNLVLRRFCYVNVCDP